VYVLKAGMVLTLPSPRQVREWRQSRLSQQANARTRGGLRPNIPWSDMTDDEKDAADQRRANVESGLGSLGKATEADAPIKYHVRLGDTLRSVAMKHPALNDVSLWKLLAEKNGLPTTQDARGVPTTVLQRGSILELPTPQEIAEYKNRTRK